MDEAHQSLTSWLTRVIHRPGFWFILVLLLVITLSHHSDVFEHPAFLTNMMANFGLDRHAFERILYLAPIVWAGFLFGSRGAIITSLAALACMLPRAVFLDSLDAIFETSAVFIVGNVLAISFNALHKERERRAHLDALNQTSSVVSQSLELSQILNNSVDTVMSVMKVDAALLFLLDEAAGELILTAHQGVSSEFAQGGDKLKLG